MLLSLVETTPYRVVMRGFRRETNSVKCNMWEVVCSIDLWFPLNLLATHCLSWQMWVGVCVHFMT